VSITIPENLFSTHSDRDFERLALETFNYQAIENPVYAKFLTTLGIVKESVKSLSNIPFLPIEFFKSHSVYCGKEIPETFFSSSGTTGMTQSKHLVKDPRLYVNSFRTGFKNFYGKIHDYTILALLPSYQEREGSSLIYMVDDFINESGNTASGYFLHNHDDLVAMLRRLQAENKKVILIGVTYALLDFIEKYRLQFPELIVMETGGMKGKRKEMIREELHEILCEGFGVAAIHSEYGMTELLSQAYSKAEGKFHCPPWMKVLIRDINDPFTLLSPGQSGGINIIDLANIHSCSFIASQDMGKVYLDGSFEVLGRFDNSDIRGCNLLIQ